MRRQNHAAALTAVGINLDDTLFPAITQCPKCCKNNLSVFLDEPADGLWLACDDCKTRGNIVSFAAQIWNTGVIDATKRFVQLGLITAADCDRGAGHEERRNNHWLAAGDFWEITRAQVQTAADDIIRVKLRELGLAVSDDKFDGLVGVAGHDDILRLCDACQIEAPRKIKTLSAGLVLKFEDLPQRITGFLITQYDKDFQPRHVFVPISKGRGLTKLDAGYYLLQNAFVRHPKMGDSVFVVDDPFWVLRAQITQIKYGLDPLPLCASYHNDKIGSSGKNWSAFPKAQRFFYSETSTADALSQAGLSRGYVAPPIRNAYSSPTRPTQVIKKLVEIRRTATGWKTVLASLLQNANVLQARAIARRLEIPKDALQNFCVSAKIPNHIAEHLLDEAPRTIAAHNNKTATVIERNEQWVTTAGHLVADGVIRITHVFQNDAGEQTYRGYAQIKHQRIDFTERAGIIEKTGLLKYVRYKAGQNNLLFVFDPRYNGRSHLLALQMSPPTFIKISDKIGWDDETATFRFPNFSITTAGAIVSHEFFTDKIAAFPEPTVAAPISIHHVLTPAHEHAAVWAGVTALIGNIVAPIVKKNFFATAITDPAYFETLSLLGQQLACKTTRAVSLTSIVNLANIVDWPHIVDAPYDKKRLQATVVRHQQSPLVLQTLPATAVSALTYGWYSLQTTHEVTHKDFTWLPYILPPYIQHMLRRRMTLSAEKDFLHAVMADLHTWLQENYGTTFNLDCAQDLLRGPTDSAITFMEFVAQCVEKSLLEIIPRPRRKDQEKNYLLANPRYWWINEQAITRIFAQQCGLAPDWVFLRQALDKAGVFLRQNTVHNMAGFNVNADWASTFFFRENGNAAQVTYGN